MAEIQGHITLIGDDFDISSVTNNIAYSPTWVKRKTDILGNGRPFGHCEWGLETEMLIADELLPVADLLISLFKCSGQTLRQIACDCHAEWHILFLIKVTDDFPVIVLPPAIIKFAAEIDATIGFDVYMLN